jgi:hypothetical protein
VEKEIPVDLVWKWISITFLCGIFWWLKRGFFEPDFGKVFGKTFGLIY